MIELVIIVVVMGLMVRMLLPRLSVGKSRADAGAQQVRSVFLTALRSTLTNQSDVIVSFDTARGRIRIAEDRNNNGLIDSNEVKYWRSLGDGNAFRIPPVGCSCGTVNPGTPIVGASLKTVDNFPTVVFHRDGSTSSAMEVYLAASWKGRTDYRLVTLTRSTGRSDLWKFSGKDASGAWLLASQQ
ncbi:MAG: hypothetical protein JWN53_197 [Gemmatimonadetes bacterium]|jgi:hypothetical protein|nr:hypothetical protein [Gemmatimonadota bacterium]